jgi:hypothetical protein
MIYKDGCCAVQMVQYLRMIGAKAERAAEDFLVPCSIIRVLKFAGAVENVGDQLPVIR